MLRKTGTTAGLLLAVWTNLAAAQLPLDPRGGPGAGSPSFGTATPYGDMDDYIFRPPPPMRIRDASWHYIDPTPPRQIKLHDIITVVVDEKSETVLGSTFNRQRNNTLKAELKEFIRIGKTGNLENAADNQPSIDANLMGQMRNTGQVVEQEGIRYRIAATVVNVLPNGNVVIEARKRIRSDRDSWEFTLTGVIDSLSIRRDNTALSENIANLQITKDRSGKVFDSTKRHWGIRIYDVIWPF